MKEDNHNRSCENVRRDNGVGKNASWKRKLDLWTTTTRRGEVKCLRENTSKDSNILWWEIFIHGKHILWQVTQ